MAPAAKTALQVVFILARKVLNNDENNLSPKWFFRLLSFVRLQVFK